MEPNSPTERTDAFRDLPDGVVSVIECLTTAGHEAYLVGGCVRNLLLGEAVTDYDVTTSASPDAALGLFPRAVPIGLHHGTIMVPSPDGPVDVTSFRAGPDLAADLARRDFTINAIAFDCEAGAFVDPFDGRTDLAEKRLRSVGAAEDRFREDPLRMLRAARLAATLEFALDPTIEPAMAAARPSLATVARERIRSELERLFSAADPSAGLAILRRTGIEAGLAPGIAADAIDVVAALPPDDVDLRLAAWLRGTLAPRILGELRFPRRTRQHVAHLLRLHPFGAGVNPKRDAAVRKLIKQARLEDVAGLCALRRAELSLRAPAGEADLAQLDRVEAAIARVLEAGALALRRFDIAISGREVMEILGCGPGRRVGQALRFLTDAVVEDPAANEPARLRELLDGWAAKTETNG